MLSDSRLTAGLTQTKQERTARDFYGTVGKKKTNKIITMLACQERGNIKRR